MLQFEKCRFKNFLSYGNAPTEFQLNLPGVTLISGKNGNGKSTVIDAICFALFGKSYRKITKDNLINNINKKETLVELWFSDGMNDYQIVRGIKPNVFKVFRDGKELDNQTSVGELQDWLETNVLRMNYATFCQIIVLGSANYTPFMQLSTAGRREVVDSMLDTYVFGDMAKVLREKLNAHSQAESSLDREKSVLEATIQTHEQYANRAEEETQRLIQELRDKLSTVKQDAVNAQAEIEKNEQLHTELTASIETLKQKKKARDTLLNEGISLENSAKTLRDRIKFFETTPVCSQCEQNIEAEHVHDSVAPLKEKLAERRSSARELKEKLISLDAEIAELEQKRTDASNLSYTISSLKTELNSLMRRGSELTNDIKRLKQKAEPVGDVAHSREQLKLLSVQEESLVKEKRALNICSVLLKDTGIKASIVKNYIPMINQLVKKYLDLFDFYPRVEFDENFNEKITLRSSTYEYNQFSMGQRTRLNLAMLFTWREIARLRAQASCNLLFFDEIFDSSLDAQGAEDLMVILGALGDVSVYIISHRGDQFVEKVDRHIVIENTNNFSRQVLSRG